MMSEQVSIPGWALKVFGWVQPIVVFLAGWVLVEMRGLRDQVTILNVQMQQALETKGELKAIDTRFNLLSERMSRIEGKVDWSEEKP